MSELKRMSRDAGGAHTNAGSALFMASLTSSGENVMRLPKSRRNLTSAMQPSARNAACGAYASEGGALESEGQKVFGSVMLAGTLEDSGAMVKGRLRWVAEKWLR